MKIILLLSCCMMVSHAQAGFMGLKVGPPSKGPNPQAKTFADNALFEKFTRVGESGLSEVAGWIIVNNFGEDLRSQEMNGVGRYLLRLFLDAPDRANIFTFEDSRVVWRIESAELGAAAKFSEGEFLGFTDVLYNPFLKYIEVGDSYLKDLAYFSRTGPRWEWLPEQEEAYLQILRSAILNSSERRNLAWTAKDGTRIFQVEAPDMFMALRYVSNSPEFKSDTLEYRGVVSLYPEGKQVLWADDSEESWTPPKESKNFPAASLGLLSKFTEVFNHQKIEKDYLGPAPVHLSMDEVKQAYDSKTVSYLRPWDGEKKRKIQQMIHKVVENRGGDPIKLTPIFDSIKLKRKVSDAAQYASNGLLEGRDFSVVSMDKYQKFIEFQKPLSERAMDALSVKARGIVETAVIRPMTFALQMPVSALSMVKNFFSTVVSMFKGLMRRDEDRWMPLKANVYKLREDLGYVTSMRSVAGVAGYLLSFSPKNSAVHKLSEKLDNWGTWGILWDDQRIREAVKPQDGKSILIYHGVGNNMFRKQFYKEKEYSFKNLQIEFLQSKLYADVDKYKYDKNTKELGRQLIQQMDFLAVYPGQAVADSFLSAFEGMGWPVVSRKLVEPHKEKTYKVIYPHSAGGYSHHGHAPEFTAEYIRRIGAEGAFNGIYRNNQTYAHVENIAHKHDPILHTSPIENGPIGIRFSWGKGGNADLRKAPGNPAFWDVSANHSYIGYVIGDIPNLIKIFDETYISLIELDVIRRSQERSR